MKKLMTAVMVTGLLLSGAAWAKDYSKIKIATEGAYAPWNLKDSSGKLVGFELDLAAELCKRMKVECQIVEQAWDGMIPSLKAGKYDAIMAGMSITEKRLKVIAFSRPYAVTQASFVVAKDSPMAKFDAGIASVSLGEVDAAEKAALAAVKKTFSGKTIGVQTATTHEAFLREHLKDDVDIRSYDTQENLDLDLQAGRVDAALADTSYWKPMLDSDKGKGLMLVGPSFSGGPWGIGVGAGIRKKDQALADMFSKAIAAASADGTISKLATKWFGFDASAKD